MGYSERREREIQSRKQSILECSRKLFDEKGFDGSTMDDIAAAADLTKATIYKYFCSKQELLGALLLMNIKTLLKRFDEAEHKYEDPRQKLTAFGDVFLRFMQSEVPGSIGSYLLHLDFKSTDMSKDLRMELRSHLEMLFAKVKELITDGVEKEVFNKSFDPTLMSLVIWGASIGIQVLKAKLTPDILPDFGEDVFKEVLKLISTGLLENHTLSGSLAKEEAD